MGDRFERIGDITQLRQKFVGYVEAPVAVKEKSGTSPRKRRPPPKAR